MDIDFDKLITLPPKEEMLKRLLQVDDNTHAQQKLYPMLTKHGGEQRTLMGVVMLLQLAIHDYTEGLPGVIARMLHMRMNDFIDAVCPNEQTATEVKALYEHARAAE